jgi:pimeloyl-ACP methyl ester carboxylesterase
VVIGQSLGGHTAFLLAAQRPHLVRALVVAEATPERDPDAPQVVGEWLGRWPVPFASRAAALASRAAALAHFGDTPWGRAWSDGLKVREDGLEPAFDTDVMIAALGELAGRSYWEEWSRIACPALVLHADGGDIPAAVARRMVEALPCARAVKIAGAGHDLHLDQPLRFREAVSGFLATLVK